MALGDYRESLLRGASTALDNIKVWLSGGVGSDSLPAKPRLEDVDRMTVDTMRVKVSPYIDVTSYGTVVGDGVVDDSAAIAAVDVIAAAAGTSLRFGPGTYRFAQDTTLTAHTMMMKGAMFTGTSSITMPVPDAGRYQVFGSTLTVIFSGAGKVYPEWQVSKLVVALAGIQKMLSAMAGGSVIDFAADYTIDGVLSVPGGMILCGHGIIRQTATTIIGQSRAVFDLNAVTDVIIKSLRLYGSKTGATQNSANASIATLRGAKRVTVDGVKFFDSQNAALAILDDASNNPSEDIIVRGCIATHCGGDADPGAGSDLWGPYALISGRRIVFEGNTADGISADKGAYLIDLEVNNASDIIEDVSIIGNVGRNTGNIIINGEAAASNANIRNINVIGNVCEGGGGGGGGAKIRYADRVNWVGNTDRNMTDQGLIVHEAINVTVDDFDISEYGSSGANQPGINVQDNSTVKIGNGRLAAKSGATTPYGIRETGSGSVTLITGRIVTQNITDASNEIAIGANSRQAHSMVALALDPVISTMSGNETFRELTGTFLRKNPNGTTRTLNPTGTFSAGILRIIRNSDNPGGGDIQFDSTSLNHRILPAQYGLEIYTGSAWETIDFSPVQEARQTLSSAQILALNTTAPQVIPGHGSNSIIEIVGGTLIYVAGATPYTIGAGDDLILRYTDRNGVIASEDIETTGFISSASNQFIKIMPLKNVLMTLNAPIVIHCRTADPTAGNGTMQIRLLYRVHFSGL